jgi:hypothetical protein
MKEIIDEEMHLCILIKMRYIPGHMKQQEFKAIHLLHAQINFPSIRPTTEHFKDIPFPWLYKLKNMIPYN